MTIEKTIPVWATRIHAALDGRTQAWLAEQTGIEKSTLASIINKSMPSADKAVKIAQCLGLTVEYLMTGSDSGPMPSMPLAVIINEADADIRAIEAELSKFGEWPLSLRARSQMQASRAALERHAKADYLPESVKSQADRLLDELFEDAAARDRQQARLHESGRRLLQAGATVDSAFGVAGKQPTVVVREALKALVHRHGIRSEELLPLAQAWPGRS